jgi:hypothetical protein
MRNCCRTVWRKGFKFFIGLTTSRESFPYFFLLHPLLSFNVTISFHTFLASGHSRPALCHFTPRADLRLLIFSGCRLSDISDAGTLAQAVSTAVRRLCHNGGLFLTVSFPPRPSVQRTTRRIIPPWHRVPVGPKKPSILRN